MRDRYASLKPDMIISSMASMPRRWRDAIRVDPPKKVDDFFTVEGPDGRSAAEHVGSVIAQLTLLSRAIRTTSYRVPEPLSADVAAAVNNLGSGPWPQSASEGLSQLDDIFAELETQLKQTKTYDWNKAASVTTSGAPADGVPSTSGSLSVLELAQGASRVAAEHLPLAERILRSVSR